jgi:hypothetical protein
MEKLADKKRMTTEEAASYIMSVEFLFLLLMVEFIIMRLLPFKISNYVMYGAMIVIYGFTNFVVRKSMTRSMLQSGIRKEYKLLDRSVRRNYLILSVFLFFIVFFVFFAAGVLTIGDYDKLHP